MQRENDYINSLNSVFSVEMIRHETKTGSEVEITLDLYALKLLIARLESLQTVGDHAHFFSEKWGGSDLTKIKFNKDGELIDHLRITLVNSKNVEV